MTLVGKHLNRPVLSGSILNKGLSGNPDGIALVSTVTADSWRQIDQNASRLATGYLGLGLQVGDRIASLMPNRAALLVHYLACLKSGLVSVPLNYRYMAPEIDHALEVSEASLVLVHAERRNDLADCRLTGSLPRGLVVYDDDGSIDGETAYSDLLEPSNPSGEFDQMAPDSAAVLFFTSGSTGKPKAVVHTHESVGWMLASLIQSYRITASDILMPATSCSHLGSFMVSLAGLAAGARVDIVHDFNAGELLRLLRKTRPTVLKILPAVLGALLRDHGARPDDFTSLRLCIAGGDKISADLEKHFKNLAGLDVTEIYGMTETGSATFNPLGADHKNGSIGKPGAGYRVEIRDDKGNEMPLGTDGRFWIGFPGIFARYWNNPQATARTKVDGWVDTGDIASLDEDGCLWFRGRSKQIIVHDGSNICPQEVEDAVSAHPAVAAACAVGVRHPVHGENVRAYVTLEEGADRPTDAEMIALARRQIGYKAPEEIVVLDEMPFLASGKIDREGLKRMASGNAAG